MEVTIKLSDESTQYPTSVIVHHSHNHGSASTRRLRVRKRASTKLVVSESPDEEETEDDDIEDVDEELANAAQAILPANTLLTSAQGNPSNFVCEAKVPIKSKEEFTKWLKTHSQLSSVTYRLRNTIKSLGKKVIYKAVYRCQHNTLPRRNSKPSKKHTGCGATLAVVIRKALNESSAKGIKISQYPTLIKLHHNHNHRLKEDVTLKHKDPTDEVKDKLLKFFKNGANPAQALHILTAELTEEYDDDVVNILSDRSKCPDINWIYRLYYANYEDLSGLNDFETMVENLKNIVDCYEEKHGGNAAKMALVNEKDVIVAICSPLMKRCHSLSTAAEVVYVDSSGNTEKFNCKVYVLLINSCTGGLPIGVIISTSEKETVLASALQLYLELLSAENCFGGRGKVEPEIFLTEDLASVQNSISYCFPESKLFLSHYHLLQGAWKWIWDANNEIKPENRKQLFSLLSDMIKSKSALELEEVYASVTVNETTRGYPSFQKYVEVLYQKRQMWCISQGNHNNEIIQSTSISVLKDKVFKRTKSLNLAQLFEFLFDDLSNYYTVKLLRTLGSGKSNPTPCKYMCEYAIDDLDLIKVSEEEFIVTHKLTGKEYVVGLDIGVCSCPLGVKSVPCKHRCAVVHKFKIESANGLNKLDAESRKMFYHIATGEWEIGNGWNSSPAAGNTNWENRDICEWDSANPELLRAKLSEANTVPQSFRDIWEQCGRLLLPYYKNNPDGISQRLQAFRRSLSAATNEESVIAMFRTLNKK
ncbi:hypothetical protein CHUAL_014212 [Chamberlinius hualienensis]